MQRTATLPNWKNSTLTGANTMATKIKNPSAELFSHILRIEDLTQEIKDGTITNNEIVTRLDWMHKRLCLLIEDPTVNPNLKENTTNAS
jgi:hypothetical protein